MNEKLQKVMQKVVQLRALAAKAGTQAEAETAAAQAEALIAKYQIDEATIRIGAPVEEIEEGEALWSGTQNEQWRGALVAGLCKDHGCAAIAWKCDGKTEYRIAGRASDVSIVRYMFAWLSVEIDRLSRRERGKSAKNAFRCGAVAGVLDAMRAARKAEVQATSNGQSVALAIVSRADESMAFLKSKIDGTFRKSAPRAVNGDAFQRGKAAGSNLAPRHGLSEGAPRMLGRG